MFSNNAFLTFNYPYKQNGYLSATSEHNIMIEGKIYNNVMEYYNSAMMLTPEANNLDVMYLGLRTKFTQNNDICEKLLNTKNKVIIYNSKKDDYWGVGKGKTGENNLGVLLMMLRDDLRDMENMMDIDG